jgi:hypothetical protein
VLTRSPSLVCYLFCQTEILTEILTVCCTDGQREDPAEARHPDDVREVIAGGGRGKRC